MKTLEEILALVVQYYENPTEYLDLENLQDYDGEGSFVVRRKPLSDVIDCPALGTGWFSEVFDLGDRVLKINKADRQDEGYQRFAQYCKDHPSQYLPKVYAMGEVSGQYYYVVEKLDAPTPEEKNFLRDIAVQAMHKGASARPMNRFLKSSLPQEFLDTVHQLYVEYSNNTSYLRWDLHGENMMLRGDTPVVTDPWADNRY